MNPEVNPLFPFIVEHLHILLATELNKHKLHIVTNCYNVPEGFFFFFLRVSVVVLLYDFNVKNLHPHV